MLRSVLGAVAAATVISLVPTSGPVAAAAARQGGSDPLAGLAVHPEWGSITGRSGVLRHGCHTYTYTYSITPPDGIWAIEVYISGPGHKHLAGGAFLDGYDPKTGTGTYKLCNMTTRYGRFTIEAKVSTDNGGQIKEGRLPADYYRLGRPHHR